MARHDRPADRTDLDEWLAALPGGEHIVPHVDEGPYRLVCVTDAFDPAEDAQAVLHAYPGVLVPYVFASSWHRDLKQATIHAVPKYGYEVLVLRSSPGELALSPHQAGPFPEPPSPLEVLRFLPAVLEFGHLPQGTAGYLTAAEAAAAVSGPDAALALINQLQLTGTDPAADVRTLTAALAALAS